MLDILFTKNENIRSTHNVPSFSSHIIGEGVHASQIPVVIFPYGTMQINRLCDGTLQRHATL